VPITFYGGDNGNGDDDCLFSKGVAGFFNGIYWLIGRITKLLGISPTGRPVTRFKTYIPVSKDKVVYNRVDAALATPNELADVDTKILDVGEVVWIVGDPEVGLVVKKSGRTTALTSTRITAVEAVATINYGGGRVAYFENQIIFDNPNRRVLAGGDSGSFLLSMITNHPVGLCFAGSTTVGIANTFKDVAAELPLAQTKKRK